MNRPVDWTPLAAGDPIPGDPDLVEQAGRDYRRIAQAIETAASRLRMIASDMSMQSDAVAQIRDRAESLAGKVGRAQDRYEAIGVALVGYAASLTEAQASSLRALRLAQDAHHDLLSARWAVNDAQRRALLDPAAPADLISAQRREQTAAAGIADALAILDRALQDRDDAAEAARRVIDAAKSQDGLNDSRWDNIKAATISVLESVAKVVDLVAVGAGVLALLFAAVPFVGEFFAAVALLASIASLALKLTLKAFGEGSWLDIGLAALGVAAFGVGKVAIGSGELAATGARVSARAAAGRFAAEATEAGAAGGLRSADSVVSELMGAANNATRSRALSAAENVEKFGPGAHLENGIATIRSIPEEMAEDLKNVRQFDAVHPVSQIRRETPLHPLSFLGERAAAADSVALKQLDDTLLADHPVATNVLVRNVSTGAYVTTWLCGDWLLYRDTRDFLHGELTPAQTLDFADRRPSGIEGAP